jgi:hypothetical protein
VSPSPPVWLRPLGLLQFAEHTLGSDFARPQDRIGADLTAVARDHVERALIGREKDAVGPGQALDDARHLAGRADVVDGEGPLRLLDIAPVFGVGEVDAAVPIDHEIIGSVEAFAVVALGQNLAKLAARTHRDHTARAALAGDQRAIEREHQAVGAAAARAHGAHFAVCTQAVDLGRPHVAEVEAAVRRERGPLGEDEARRHAPGLR